MIVKPTKGLTEAEGRKVLREAFTAAGFHIVEDFAFDEEGVSVSLDGWDPVQRVGYEYVTKESHDRENFTDPKIGKLYQRMSKGELALLLIDGEGHPDATILTYLARHFLDSLVVLEQTQAGFKRPTNTGMPVAKKD